MVILGLEQINEMIAHYINLKIRSRRQTPGTYNEAWICGEIEEAEKWLNLCGFDTSYENVEKLIKETE